MFAKIILSCLLRIEATLGLKSTIELDIIPFDKLLYDPQKNLLARYFMVCQIYTSTYIYTLYRVNSNNSLVSF